MEWTGKITNTTPRDELIGGWLVPIVIENAKVTNAEYKRGEILAEENGVYKLATTADTDKKLVIVARDHEAGEDNDVAAVYTQGMFNRERLNPRAADDSVVKALSLELKRQGYNLTTIMRV